MLEAAVTEMKKVLNYKSNRDGVETLEYVYANYFLARKLAERERRHLLGMLAEELPDSRVNLYTHNPTPELPGVHNVGAVDYYNDMNNGQKAEFCKQAMIPQGVSLEIEYFEEFYEARKVVLTERIRELLG